MRKRQLIFVAPRAPYPMVAGYRLRMHYLATLLADRFDVHLVCLEPFAPGPIPAPFASVTSFTTGVGARLLRSARHAAGGLPLQVGGHIDPRAMAWLRSRASDLCYLFQIRTAPYAKAVHAPVVLDYVDAVSMHYINAGAVARGVWRAFYALEGARLRAYEVDTLERVQAAFVSSPVDREYLLTAGGNGKGTPIGVVPMGVRPEVLAYRGQAEEAGWIIMSGRMGYYPNRDAADYFARRVFPLLRRRDRSLQFIIVGTDPPRPVRRLEAIPGVHVTGYVEDPWNYVARACVSVAPIRMGAGIQTKVLEAMALGKPVVASPLAVRGIEAGIDGSHFVVANDPEATADAIWGLLQDGERRSAIGRAASQLIREQYTWERVGASLFAALRRWV